MTDHGQIYEEPKRRIDLVLLALLLFGLAARVAFVIHLPGDMPSLNKLPDQVEYLQLGQNLHDERGLNFVDPRFADVVYAFRAPGYPALIALCGARVAVVRLVQCGLDTLTAASIYFLARRWLGRSHARLAAALIIVNPFLIYFCGLVLSETLFITLLTCGLTLMVCQPSDGWRGLMRWWLGLVLLATAALVRPSALALPVLAALGSSFANRRQGLATDAAYSPPPAAAALLVSALVLTPWAWRNHSVLGQWIWTTTNSGITAYDGLNPDATGASDQRFVADMSELSTMSEIQRDRYLGDKAKVFVHQHPRQALRLAWIKLARFWSPVPLSDDYGGNLKIVIIALLYSVPFDLLVLLSLWQGTLPGSARMYLLLAAVYFSGVHAVSVGSLRYRIPADVPLAVLAADGICRLARRRSDASTDAESASHA